MIVRELLTKWGFKVDDKALKRLDNHVKGLTKSFAIIGAAGVATGAALFGLAKSTAAYGDNISKTANKLGVGVEALQELRHAAELSGVKITAFDMGLQRFTRRLDEARNGSGEALTALQELGKIAGKDLIKSNKSAADTLTDLATAFEKIDDSGKRVRLAFKLFDSEGVSMVNMLQSGGKAFEELRQQARDLGFVLSEQETKNAVKFQDSWVQVKRTFMGLKNVIGNELIPIFQKYMDMFLDYAKNNRELLRQKVIDYFYKLGEAIKWVGRILAMYMTFRIAMVIGSLAQIVTLTAKAALGFKTLGNAAFIANLKVFAIGIAILALIGIVEDFVGMLMGKDSLFGDLFGKETVKSVRAYASGKSEKAKEHAKFLTEKMQSGFFHHGLKRPIYQSQPATAKPQVTINVNATTTGANPHMDGKIIAEEIEKEFLKAGIE